MLENIKSIYFIQKIFSYLDVHTKLGLIKYNKTLQNNLDISITNYKHFEGKYLIYEKKLKYINLKQDQDLAQLKQNYF